MISYKAETRFSQLLAMVLGSMLTYAGWVPTAWAQEGTAQLIRIFENDDFFSEEFFKGVNPNFSSGLAFPPGAHTLLLSEQPVGGGNVVLVAPPENERAEVSRTDIPTFDPINIAFDSVAKGAKGQGTYRIFLLDGNGELVAIKTNASNVADPATVKRSDARPLSVSGPQGMTFDPSTDCLFILDGVGPSIVRLCAAMGRDFDKPGPIAQIALPPGLGDLRGLAFDPESGHLFVFNPSAQTLYELTVTGEMVAAVKLPGFQPADVQGMIFTHTVDQTDPPSATALYIAASNGPHSGVSEWSLGAR